MVKSSETERKERMDTSSLMEQILSSDNLNRAYLQVVRNKGAEGVDGMKYTELKEHLAKNGEIIKEQLRTRKYKPQPVRRVEIPKPDGGVRNLGIPTVTDRFVQQAIAQVLTPIYEEQFHDQSYGFRPNRCAQQAILGHSCVEYKEEVFVMIVYDRLWITLKKKNISQYALIKDYGIDKAQLQRLRKNMVVKTVILNRLCSILDCKIEDIMEFVPDEDIK